MPASFKKRQKEALRLAKVAGCGADLSRHKALPLLVNAVPRLMPVPTNSKPFLSVVTPARVAHRLMTINIHQRSDPVGLGHVRPSPVVPRPRVAEERDRAQAGRGTRCASPYASTVATVVGNPLSGSMSCPTPLAGFQLSIQPSWVTPSRDQCPAQLRWPVFSCPSLAGLGRPLRSRGLADARRHPQISPTRRKT
jgi:hypothetical protein